MRLHLVCVCLALTGARKPKPSDGEGTDRLRSEIDTGGAATEAQPPQSAELAAKEAAATSRLDAEYHDGLKDIMAVLVHGSEASKDAALERLVGLAVSTGEASREQARLFRSAVVAGGALPAVISTLGDEEPRRKYLAAAALHALALDDPETDFDNFHQAVPAPRARTKPRRPRRLTRVVARLGRRSAKPAPCRRS